MSNRAWVTLATNDSYGLGALVLAHSLRRASSVYPAVVLITPSVTEPMRERLRAVYAEVVVVDVLDSRDAAHLALLQRPELGITFTKIHCWNLTQYEKCVFLDADTLVVQNCDELFEREELSAAPDVGWPDCFNSGVFVYRPSGDTFSNLVKFASERGSFDGGDQGLLNSFFSDWAQGDINKHLPFLYNVTSAAFYSYLPALKHYGQNLKIIHFIGAVKPWLQQYNWQSRSVQAPEHLKDFLQLWWDLFVAQVHAQLDTNMDEGYIEEPEPTVYHHEEAIEYNEPIVQQFGYYEPSLDSESEFPWHHPENQISDTEVNAPQIDMSQFFDPWNIYRGNIPFNKEDCGETEKTDDYENMRKYAWDYVPAQHSQHQIEIRHNYEHITQPQHYTNISERVTQPQYYTNINEHITRSHIHDVQHDNHSTHHYHNPTQTHNWQCNTESSQNVFHHSEYTPSLSRSTYDYNYEEDSHTHASSHEFGYYNQQHNDSQHHNDSQQHNDSQHHNDYHHQNQEQHIQHSYSQSKHHSTQSHREPYHPQEHHYDNRDFYEEKHEHPSQNQNETETNVSYLVVAEQNQITKRHNHMNDFTYLQLKNRNREEQIYTVMMDHVRIRTESVKVNGYESDSESDIYDDITPRHPYDGFYLRHRMTIDSRGRKICSHEIPYIPRSPSPSSSDDFEDALENTPEDDSIVNGEDIQTGVAGNLARVVPGAPLQQEAVDELSRRQGWEAGNIDYMGADSFDNIWAKISQTLSQSPASPDQDSGPQAPQEEAKPISGEQAPVEPEPVAEKESVSEVPAEKVAEVPVEVKKVPEEVPELESEKPESVAQTEPAALPAEAPLPSEEIEVPVPASEAAEVKPEEPIPVPAEAAAVEIPAESAPVEAQREPAQEIPVAAVEALKIDEPAPKSAETETVPEPAPAKPETAAPELAASEPAAPEPAASEPAAPVSAAPAIPLPAAPQEPAPAVVSESVPEVVETKPEETAKAEPASDSPPLANTPSKEEIPVAPAPKSERRKLQLPPPAADALPTPDSEHEDAATLAHAIIASELHASTTPASTASSASPASPVSLSQIGVKVKPSTAAQIESSVPKQPKSKTEGDAPKKKIIKKVVKKEASGDTPAPVPPPRKKEKKPKEK